MAQLQHRWSLRAVTLILGGKRCLVQDFQAIPGQMSLCAVPAHPLPCPALPASSSRIPLYVAGPRHGCPATPSADLSPRRCSVAHCSLSALCCAESSMACKWRGKISVRTEIAWGSGCLFSALASSMWVCRGCLSVSSLWLMESARTVCLCCTYALLLLPAALAV